MYVISKKEIEDQYMILKIQHRPKDTILNIPASMKYVLGTADYVRCTCDKDGLHYKPVKD